MKSTHQLYLNYREGSISEELIIAVDDQLGLAESALHLGDRNYVQSSIERLSECEVAFINFRAAQIANDFDSAQEHLKVCVESSRKSGSRNHSLEARARMEWGLLRFTQGEEEQAGVDLRWAMERLKALDEGSIHHGLALLNLAEWHVARNEIIMALVILAEIGRDGPHAKEIIGQSRLQTAKIHFELGDFNATQRHAWVAFVLCASLDIIDSAMDAALIWLDLSLNSVCDEAPRMKELTSNPSPRELGEEEFLQSNPLDIITCLDWIYNHHDGVFSGVSRPDLVVIIEAEKAVGMGTFCEILNNSDEIEDTVVTNLLII